jgi:hypothetical protein
MSEEVEEVFYCANHPNRETTLRCNRCEKPICTQCAILTPTGYRCKECVRGLQKVFDNTVWYDHLIGFLGAAVLSGVASLIISLISGFFYGILVIFAAPAAGALIARGVQAMLRKHRSRPLFLTVAAGVVFGALPMILVQATSILFAFGLRGGGGSIFSFLPLIWQIVYLAIATPAVYRRLSGLAL